MFLIMRAKKTKLLAINRFSDKPMMQVKSSNENDQINQSKYGALYRNKNLGFKR